MCKAGFAGDDAPRAVSILSSLDRFYRALQYENLNERVNTTFACETVMHVLRILQKVSRVLHCPNHAFTRRIMAILSHSTCA